MINEPPPFKGRNMRIPATIPIKGRGFINQGSGLGMNRASTGGFCTWRAYPCVKQGEQEKEP